MKIHLFCFNKQTEAERVKQLESLEYHIDFRLPDGPDFIKNLKQNPPDMFVIDLTRTPSQGRDMGVYLRCTKPTRLMPLVFVGGDEGKVNRVKALLPDAVYASWENIEAAMAMALDNPPNNPVIPESVMAGYSNAPLMKKLGIREGMAVGLVNAPKDARDILGALLKDVQLSESLSKECSLYLWFLHSTSDLDRDLPSMVKAAGHGRIWMIWAKKGSPLAADVTQRIVRDRGLSAGLVDYKVCAVNKDWTGLLFAKRRASH